jgi:hypothetical protein
MKATPLVLFGTLLALTPVASGQSPRPEAARAAAPQAATPPGRSEDEKAIRAVIDAFSLAFARGDARAIAAMFTEQGEAIATDGAAIRGREAQEAH